MFDGKERFMGLGPMDDVPLADARRKAKECRALARDGHDPINARKRRKQETRVEAAKAITFKECAERYIDSNKAGWRNEKHVAQWTSSLETYAYPVFGALPVQAVDTALVTKVLEPIWTTKTETATRVRQRVEAVLDWAKACGHRTGDNPARWKGHLNKLMPSPSKVRKVKHHAAMPYAELPGFFTDLLKRKNISAKAMTFAILTGGRTTETLLASRKEIDLDNAIWTVPGERTKSGREHRVPLPKEAMALLRGLTLGDNGAALLFPNLSGERQSENAMRQYLQQDMGWGKAATPHGFRSTFKNWVNDQTNYQNYVVEAALAHVVGDKTEAAYRRSDALDKRRRLMEAWAKYCVSGSAAGGKVVPIRKR